jgi:hypothetical protein
MANLKALIPEAKSIAAKVNGSPKQISSTVN